jgi:predicted nucleotidyltransferase
VLLERIEFETEPLENTTDEAEKVRDEEKELCPEPLADEIVELRARGVEEAVFGNDVPDEERPDEGPDGAELLDIIDEEADPVLDKVLERPFVVTLKLPDEEVMLGDAVRELLKLVDEEAAKVKEPLDELLMLVGEIPVLEITLVELVELEDTLDDPLKTDAVELELEKVLEDPPELVVEGPELEEPLRVVVEELELNELLGIPVEVVEEEAMLEATLEEPIDEELDDPVEPVDEDMELIEPLDEPVELVEEEPPLEEMLDEALKLIDEEVELVELLGDPVELAEEELELGKIVAVGPEVVEELELKALDVPIEIPTIVEDTEPTVADEAGDAELELDALALEEPALDALILELALELATALEFILNGMLELRKTPV